ncbi:amine oxidase [Burkholderia ubonensis]|uniref:flavin monoamine oxidase family protein n=1 Tax=Burkholderia ubonensis TaxID=101571 RepID=UPI00075D7AC2|nr:FAD-dependent oxidoreductase [Burkholderia ubonensis]KVC70531.1 amine oxidase [Burkholderia ubonensis]KVN61941.1 amine oxidase [Burkholderia ubonensis]KWI22133.1 amine oxidase [Burkholderia ubonensis]KWI23109.1 amine oxidase [Burkholderia ubonensis]ODQ39540.1 amine oxidase [Burkholderia ubonensis]
MAKKSSSNRSADPQRRQWLKYAGTSVAAAGIAMGAARANAGAAQAAGSPGDVLDIVIVGAGLAGLTAARDLRYAGCESFLVLEARDRVGGRTLNYDVGNGYVSEVGGQWIGPGQTAVADLARELEVGTFPSYYKGKTVVLGGDGRVEMELNGTFGTDEAIGARLGKLSRDVPSGAPWKSPKLAELDKLSVGDWLATQNIAAEDRIGWNGSIALSGGVMPAKMGLLHFLSMINSADCDYSQLDSIRHSAQETRFVGGSQILSNKMARQLGDKVRLSSPVRRIADWDRDVVAVHTDRGVVRARKVIMAIHPALCNQVQFDPPLPEKRAALQRAWPAHSPARKTAMIYKRPFWRDKGLNGHIFQFDGPIIWAYDNSPPGGEIGIINAFVKNAVMPSDLQAAQRMQTEIYAQAWGKEALSPVAYHDRDWGQADPWTITCVSAIPPGFWSAHGEALRPPCGNLIWSGTETANIWAGYMDGAVRSGHQGALQALNALNAQRRA